MSFEPVDRLPRWEWATWWDQTLARWRGEGLPSDLGDTLAVSRHFGLDPYRQFWLRAISHGHPATQGLVPHGLATMQDYDRLRPALFEGAAEKTAPLADWRDPQAAGEVVVWITVEGFFWFPRTLMGFERVFLAYYDQAELIHRMNRELLEFNLALLDGAAEHCVPTFMTIAEDMSYNHGPMISEGVFDEFLAPYYSKLTERAHELGITVIVDTDGDVTEMVPWLRRVGVEGVLPLERQAGVDAAALRAEFPDLLMVGHFDKMTMPRGEEAMRQEFERLLPTMRTGGYIPSVDHQTPPGVSLEQYMAYRKLLDEYTAKVQLAP